MNIANNVSMGYTVIPRYGKQSKNNSDKKQKGNLKSGRIKVHIGFNAAGTMARIANANKKSQVVAIERSLRTQLKAAIRYDSDDYTIRAIKKTIGKAGFKVKALGKEERMENLRKSAKAAENLKAEELISRELRAKRKARKHKEQADVVNANSAYSKYSNKYHGSDNNVNVTSEGIELSGSVQDAIGMDNINLAVIDVNL